MPERNLNYFTLSLQKDPSSQSNWNYRYPEICAYANNMNQIVENYFMWFKNEKLIVALGIFASFPWTH